MEKIEQFIRDYPEHGYRSLAQFVEDAIRRRAEELRVFQLTPRFSHLNTYENRVTVTDKKIGHDVEGKRMPRLIDVYIRETGNYEFEFWCEYCDSTKCEHVKYVVSIPHITIEPLRKRGFKYIGEDWSI
jgi:hypothetical protein